MNILSRLIANNKQASDNKLLDLLDIQKFIDNLFTNNEYIPKSSYLPYISSSKDTIEYFQVIKESGMFKKYCKKQKASPKTIEKIINDYNQLETLVDNHNNKYINDALKANQNYFDNILYDIDPNIKLDDDQRKVILTDEDYCLVIAGAGAGKTTTIAAKVKYVVEKKQIDPSQILVISFTNKAVQELKDRINKGLKIECPIATFHAVGNAIIRKNNPERLNIFDTTKLYFLIQEYFKKSILTNESLVNNLILFFSTYFDAPYEGNDLNIFFKKLASSNFSTMRSDLEEYKTQIIDSRTKKTITIQNEVLRSKQEVEIANFLYLNNIDYEYEPLYKYNILLAKKPYTPDFLIRQNEKIAYIEHFGIRENGTSNHYNQEELNTYKRAINQKILLHKQHGTNLIYTFSSYNDHRPLIEHLKELLIKNGFILEPRSNQEIMEKLISSEENRYIRKLISLICRFITNFKANGYTVDEFSRMYHATKNERTKLFLNICNDCYLEYARYLKENNAVDFEDMINESAKILNEVKEMKQKLDFKYIIVDEYQDISKQRFDLVKALSEVCSAKIISVGDDWQSIYAFSGADISLFTNFQEKVGYAKLLKIVNTYRNAQEVIDIAGNFIQRNKKQITKTLKSPKNINDPVIIYTYDNNSKKTNSNKYAIAHAVETVLDTIVNYNKQENRKNSHILLLGRFGFDGYNLQASNLFSYNSRKNKIISHKYPKLDITFMTAHASKGLGYDDVIIINGRNETYGFPSKIEDDPVLSFVIKGDRSIDYAEERRLFYVAMTRTKNRVYFIAPEQNPSEFLLEIKKDYKNVVLKGHWNSQPKQNNIIKKTCPICGYPMQYRYKNAYGLRLFICTNNPEICGFMTNQYRAGKLSIIKCDKCRDGYLIVKNGQDDTFFLGCTNYAKNGKGCNNTLSAEKYYKMFNIDEPKAISILPEKKIPS